MHHSFQSVNWIVRSLRTWKRNQVSPTYLEREISYASHPSNIQTLTPYLFVANSSQMTSSRLMRGYWTNFGVIPTLKSNIWAAYYLGLLFGWMRDMLVHDNPLSHIRYTLVKWKCNPYPWWYEVLLHQPLFNKSKTNTLLPWDPSLQIQSVLFTLLCAISLPLQIGCILMHANYLGSRPHYKTL